MKQELYVCVHAAQFPAQAQLRLRSDCKGVPVAVLDGRPPLESVCAFNMHAQRSGVMLNMTRLEAEDIAVLRLLRRSIESEDAARAVMLECSSAFSPRVEDVSGGTACSFVLDIAGTERLYGSPAQLAEKLNRSLAASGFRASIAVSANFDTSRLIAASKRGITVIQAGEEAEALADLSVAALDLDEEALATFGLWGIGTLGELSKLPQIELITRMGQHARIWRDLAQGKKSHTFQPIEPAFSLEEFCEFDSPVEQMDSLLFIAARMIECLAMRACGRALSLASLKMEMRLERGGTHCNFIRPALPTIDCKFLLKLLQLEITVRSPRAGVVAVKLTAEAGQSAKMQLGLFAPQAPEPSRLDVTIARLKAIVGEDRVGSPVLEDTHRAGVFHMEGFAIIGSLPDVHAAPARMALRRMRPAVPIRVVLRGAEPAVFRVENNRYEVEAAYGPWRTAGCWWSESAWDEQEWDVLAVRDTGALVMCLLVYDLKQNAWRLEALYD